ncbi:MAG TPA: hypothetical protein VEL07_22520 [Planctomycetota bacterium]|nr:hypothetical protein [Planctomycetota bacterium]
MPAAVAALPPTLIRRRTALDDLVRAVGELAGDSCRAVVAFGPAVAGHPDAPVDTAIVLARDDLAVLRALARRGSRFDRAGLAAPLVLTVDGIAASRDTFPLELLDIAQCHHPLHGDDPFPDLVLASDHVRLHCERELKALSIALRRRLLMAAGDEDALTLADCGDEMVRVARGLLMLRGQVAPREAAATLAAAGAAYGRSLAATLAVWRGASGWDAFAAFYDEVSALWSAVDAH